MDFNQITSNLDVFTKHRGGIGALKAFFLSCAFNGKFATHTYADAGNDFLIDLQKCGSSYDQGKIMGPNDLLGIWEGFSLVALPKSWQWMRLDQLGSIVGGGTPDTANNNYWAQDSGTPWITPADMRNQKMFITGGKRNLTDIGLKESSSRLLPIQSVVFSSRAPIGYVGITGAPLATNQGFKSCVPFLPEMAKYIYFYLMFMGPEINWRATGTTFKEISGKQFAATPIPVPPLSIQKSIVNSIEEFLSISARAEEKLLHQTDLANSARKSAVAAFSTAQTQEESHVAWERIRANWDLITGTSESMESIKLLIHDLATQGVLSGKQIFEEVQLKDISQINYGYTESANLTEVGPKFLRITDIQLGKVDWRTVPYCPISSTEEEKHLLKHGDLVFARTGATTGKSFLLKNPPRSVCASYLIRVRPDANKVLPEYLYLYFQSGQYWEDVKSGMSGTAQGGFNSSKLGALSIRIPNLETQAEIVKKTNVLLQVCESLEKCLMKQQILAEKFARSVVSESTQEIE